LKIINVLQNSAASKIAFSAKYPDLHILYALYLISPFHGWMWAARYVSTHSCLFVVFQRRRSLIGLRVSVYGLCLGLGVMVTV
jgi:hypothetical protein